MRYYFHGDVAEHDRTLIYCAKCDSFEKIDHFYRAESHRQDMTSDYERYRQTSKGWYREKHIGFTRPKHAPNAFA